MPLQHHCKKNPLSAQAAKSVFRQVIAAVAYLHSHNLAHRDLKLDNILYNLDADKVKIIDFGFCLECRDDTKLDVCCGTPHYMCPDLAARRPNNPKASDVWACGVILYILVIGKLPFFAEFEQDLYRKIQTAKHPQLPADLDPSLKSLISQIFVTDQKRRPSAQQVLDH